VEKGDLYRDAHRHIMEACKRYAEKNGLELVLVDDRAIQIPPNVNGNEVTAIISQKRVLYGAPELDITSDILKSMNNDFEAGTNKITPAEKKPADKKQSDKSKKN
jgi:Skp family chaperone for outer membrane proteins